jgi:hypothetical protein
MEKARDGESDEMEKDEMGKEMRWGMRWEKR